MSFIACLSIFTSLPALFCESFILMYTVYLFSMCNTYVCMYTYFLITCMYIYTCMRTYIYTYICIYIYICNTLLTRSFYFSNHTFSGSCNRCNHKIMIYFLNSMSLRKYNIMELKYRIWRSRNLFAFRDIKYKQNWKHKYIKITGMAKICVQPHRKCSRCVCNHTENVQNVCATTQKMFKQILVFLFLIFIYLFIFLYAGVEVHFILYTNFFA